jgi:hypothetical protein
MREGFTSRGFLLVERLVAKEIPHGAL